MEPTRRNFLEQVSQSVLLASVGSTVACDLGLTTARAADGPTRLNFGKREPLVQLLQELEIRIVEVPDDEFETMGPNVLALAPRVALALEGNEETRKRLEGVGVDVSVYRGNEISRKGDGGPTCLTRPLLRR